VPVQKVLGSLRDLKDQKNVTSEKTNSEKIKIRTKKESEIIIF